MKLSKIGFAVVSLLFSFAFATTAQQGSGFGVKAGMNYNTSGKYFRDAESVWKDPLGGVGYHAGVFYTMNSYDIYLRPELVYTETRFNTGLIDAEARRIDAPILAGIRLFRVINVFAGPSFHYTLDDNFLPDNSSDFNSRLRMGYQFGMGVSLGPVGVDLRYEREFNDQKFKFDRVFGQDQSFRSQQIVLAVSLRVFGP
ncbi:Outer membrane protein beta-barrel domain-containing protein [Algoriphagus faecimaris]|uniref:Outer membrane protein beta-barrel domain-containing protein n=1 Tax=Algoriphagus faecimaris TaxID=686796 RepID=A0A1G6MCN0_9BACT|nr:outer membrane beta-barrel protein [Algoriphagus faecimaris]SDC52705.1 Outer membrane protein beta-barrel domain-containing protein [Algoriphagus faecimaris]